MIRKIFFLILFSFTLTTNVFAYFDPGTGSYIIQLIIAFLASCYFFITNPIQFIKQKIKYFRRKNKIDKKNSK
tara:strand:+ start:66 stop:284 length:219 start_codon:yes stop_codon:yes gene_type:complete